MTTLGKTIDQIEQLLASDIEAARKLLRSYVFQECGVEERGTFGEALSLLAEHKTQHRDLAAALIRFLAVPDLIPEPNNNNHIARNIVEIALASLPDLCDFI